MHFPASSPAVLLLTPRCLARRKYRCQVTWAGSAAHQRLPAAFHQCPAAAAATATVLMEDSMMSQRVSSTSFKFQSPPIKMLAGPLSHCTRGNEGQCPFLLRKGEGGSELEVSVVWMQGTVLEILPERGTTALIRDETGTFSVYGISSVPAGKPCLSAGKYVMVMGVVQSCNPEPLLRAVKMTDLSDNPVHRSMWRLEVEDLHRNLRLM